MESSSFASEWASVEREILSSALAQNAEAVSTGLRSSLSPGGVVGAGIAGGGS